MSQQSRTAYGGGASAMSPSAINTLLQRMDLVEQKAEKIDKQYNALVKEQNYRVAVEEEIDEHIERLEKHEQQTKAELHRLEQGFEDLVSNFHRSVVEEVAQELDGFRQNAVAPIEAELRAALKADLDPIQRQMDRFDADQLNFEKTIERSHGERFTRIEKAVCACSAAFRKTLLVTWAARHWLLESRH